MAGIQDTLENWRLPAYRVQATLPDSEVEGTMIFFGNRPQYVSWIHKMFGRVIEPVEIGTFKFSQILSGKHPSLSADILICPTNPLTERVLARYSWQIVPIYVSCYVDLKKSNKDLLKSKSVKDDLRIAHRSNFQFELLKEEKYIEDFFFQMLVPTIKSRHEQRAFISNLETIKRTFRKGNLIGCYLDSQWVGALLLSHENKEIIQLANMGWIDGDEKWLKKGLVASLFEYFFDWARVNGYQAINLGSCNPFANDGPLNFKLKWGATMSYPKTEYLASHLQGTRSYLGVRFDLTSPATQSFLSSTPLLYSNRNKISVIGWNAEIPPLFRRQLDLGIEWNNLAD